jgi:Flp pilus assembly protein TadG
MSHKLGSRAREERGAVLIAGLLLALSLLMVIGAAVDLGQAFIVRRDLVSLADEAALAGSQALDLEARHAGRLALEPEQARAAALTALAGEPAVRAQASATEQAVAVRVERRFPTVLLRLVGLRTLTVAARASAEPREP